MNVLEVIRNRRSVREFSPREIPEEIVERLKESIRLAPSACNYQPWKFVLVRDELLRHKLADASHRQTFVAEAPLVVVGVGFPDKAYKRMGGNGNSVEMDIAISLDHLSLAAAAEGLGTCWIGAFSEESVREIVNAPDDSRIIALMPVGYPARPNLMGLSASERRKSAEEVFLINGFE